MLSILPCPSGGERLVSPPEAAVTSPVLLGGAQAVPLALGPRQLLSARARHRWCFTGIHWRKDWDCKAGWSGGRGLGVGLIPKTQIALIISQDCEGK